MTDLMDMETRTTQSQALAIEINELIRIHAQAQEAAGTPILGNDIVGALCCTIARMIANVPDEMLSDMHTDIGHVIWRSILMHREAGLGAPVVAVRDTDEPLQ